jgi:uncharacterized membrane protein required for colicin V production
MTPSFFDIIILTIMSTSTLLGTIYGLIDVAISTIAFFGNIIVAFLIFPFIENILINYITNEIFLNIITGIISYLLSLIFFSIFKSICKKLTMPISGGIADKSLGFIFGLLRGMVIVTIFFLLLISISSVRSTAKKPLTEMNFTKEEKPKWLFTSYSFECFSKVFKIINNKFPDLYDNINDMIISQLDYIKDNHNNLKDTHPDGDISNDKQEQEGNELDHLLKGFLKEQKQ